MKEVVVIGGGIGGLSAGVRLLQRGFSVTLVEKENRTGGYGINFSRSGFTFDLALHVVPAGGRGDEFWQMTRTLGLNSNFIRLEKGFDVYLKDSHFSMANDYERLFQDLAASFPHEKKGLERFKRDLEKYVSCYLPLFQYGASKIRAIPFFLPKIPAFLKHGQQSCLEYLEQFISDERLKTILFQPASFMGIAMSEFPTVNFMMMFYLLLKNGMYTIQGGGQALTDDLTEQFIALGGILLLGAQAEKIHINRKRARSVLLADGRLLDCEAVIAGNNLPDLAGNLIGREFFSKAYLANLDSLQPSVTVLVLNLGLDCNVEDIGINSHISMIFTDDKIDNCLAGTNIKGVSVTAHSISEPDYMGGRATLNIVAPTHGKWLTMDEQEYKQEKLKAQEQMISLVETKFLSLRKHIKVSNLATPRSMQRYTLNPGGAIMGFNCTAGLHRNLISASKLPVKNIRIGSAWSNRLGGFMQSMKSGILAAESL